MSRTYYKHGQWNAICDSCGRKFKASQLQLRWDGMRVCKKDYEDRHPSDFQRAVPDNPSVPWTSSESTDTFLSDRAFVEDTFLRNTTDPQVNTYMGYDAAMDSDGNTMIVSADQRDVDGGTDEGAGYVFVRDGTSWSQQSVLTSSNVSTNSLLSRSVDISADGNTIILGAPNDDTVLTNQGSVIIFTRSGTTWSEEQYIPAVAVSATNSYFGGDVGISDDGDTVIIGSVGASTTGLAYIFTRSSGVWTLSKTLNYSGSNINDKFGRSVAISGNGLYVWVGADGTSDRGHTVEWVYSTTWTEGTKTEAVTPTGGEVFSFRLKLSYDGSYMFASVPYAIVDGINSAGRMDVFKRSGGVPVFSHSITGPSPEAYSYFGAWFDIDKYGTTSIYSAGDMDYGSLNSGVSYEYTRSNDTSTLLKTLFPDNIKANDFFGYGVGMSSDGLYAGISVVNYDEDEINQGAIWIFSK